MLYKVIKSEKIFEAIKPMPFSDFPLDKGLEDVLAQNFWDVLLENSRLMPIFHERAWQLESNIYALNEDGGIVIFKLCRAPAKVDVFREVLRYFEESASLTYKELQRMYRCYRKASSANLQQEHQIGFNLEEPRDQSAFNQHQHFVIVGNADDIELIRNMSDWRWRHVLVSYIPYRVYQVSGEIYFEFIDLPYDEHLNPGQARGIIFDTNLSCDNENIWYMCEGNRVAAFGDNKGIAHSLNNGDIVFLYNKGQGIVAAGEVTSNVKADKGRDALYRELNWLTTKPNRGDKLTGLSAAEITRLMKSYFAWSKTMKSPFLNAEETSKLLAHLKAKLTGTPPQIDESVHCPNKRRLYWQ